jgi:hypothetical protein
MKLHRSLRRFVVPASLAIVAMGSAQTALAARIGQTAYYPAWGTGVIYGALIDWADPARARVVTPAGAQFGTVSRTGAQAVITLAAPISTLQVSGELNSCDEQSTQRKDTTQFVVRDLSGDSERGVSQIVEIGTLTNIDSCDVGQVFSFGSPTDAGLTLKRVAMDKRPSVRDLAPGSTLAGFTEVEWPLGFDFDLGADVVTFYAGGQLLFARSGHVVPAGFTSDKWLVLDLPEGQRGYTRLEVDDETGAESWLRADWANGVPQRVLGELMVKPDTHAGFGTERQAARNWLSGLFAQTSITTVFQLYVGGTGERVDTFLLEGTQSHSRITWRFDGKSIVQRRPIGDGTTLRERTWVPLRNADKVHFVFENENTIRANGTVSVLFLPRVNFYIDRGRAVAP